MSKTMTGMQIARSGAPKSTEGSLGESVGSNDSPGKPRALEDIEALKIADVIVRISKTNEG
jgi:hypothetical protein